jgi:hypothetical protein
MGYENYTPVGITREALTRECLQELRLWRGCETVAGLAVLGGTGGKFTVHVAEYGIASKRIADRAIRYIQREKLRKFRLIVD